ncbi:MAG: FHA domain-containing protein [Myxococcaceae bacterium]
MASFPALEVLTSSSPGLEPGRLVSLGPRTLIGRAVECDVVLRTQRAARRQCLVEFEHQRWWLRDLGSTAGVWRYGERVQEVELVHGDVFEVARGHAMRFLMRLAEPETVNEALEAGVRARADDDGAWSVYADWLLEQGAPLGEALSNPQLHHLQWLGALAGDVHRGELSVTWSHGVPRALALRSWRGDPHDWRLVHRLGALQRTPGCRFVRELSVDLGSFLEHVSGDEAELQRLIEYIGVLPMLERVTVTSVRELPVVKPPPYRLELVAPRPLEVELLNPARVKYRDGGGERLLVPGQRERVEAGEARLLVEGDNNGATLRNELGLWAVEPTFDATPSRLQVNGLDQWNCFVRDGDVLSLRPGVNVRINA